MLSLRHTCIWALLKTAGKAGAKIFSVQVPQENISEHLSFSKIWVGGMSPDPLALHGYAHIMTSQGFYQPLAKTFGSNLGMRRENDPSAISERVCKFFGHCHCLKQNISNNNNGIKFPSCSGIS